MEKVQYIKPFFPKDTPVIKKTDAKGNAKYYKRHSQEEIRTCSTDLETDLMCLLEPIEIIERALTNGEHLALANTLTKARQNISHAIQEIFHLIDNNIGEIEITGIYELEINSIYRWGQCVDAKLLPPDASGDRQEGPVYDHNPELIEYLKQIPPDKTEPIETILRILSDGGAISWHQENKGEVANDIHGR